MEEKNLHIRALLFRDANDGNRIDIDLLNNSPNKSLMKTTSPELHKIDFSINNIIEHVSQFNDSKQLISEQDTVVAKETNNCDCIHSRNSSLSLDSSIIDDSCESSNDESNYSINRNLKIVDNYDIHNESLNDNSSITPCSSTIDVDKDIPNIDIMQSSCGKSSRGENKNINDCYYSDSVNENKLHFDHITSKSAEHHWNITTSDNNRYTYFMNVYQNNIDESALWNSRTTLIVGDSMLYGLDETRLKNCKVRVYSGASIEDMHYNLVPLLRKKPATIIIHTGTNNSTRDTSSEIIEKLLNLKEFILLQLPECKVIFSSLINRYDDAKAQLTTYRTNKKFESLENQGHHVINNSNIDRKHLGKKGHHMTPYGTSRLAMNFIRVLKTL